MSRQATVLFPRLEFWTEHHHTFLCPLSVTLSKPWPHLLKFWKGMMVFEKLNFTMGYCTGAKAPNCSAIEYEPNPDMAGVGVLFAFLFPTGLILFIKVVHFLLLTLPSMVYKVPKWHYLLFVFDVIILGVLTEVMRLYVHFSNNTLRVGGLTFHILQDSAPGYTGRSSYLKVRFRPKANSFGTRSYQPWSYHSQTHNSYSQQPLSSQPQPQIHVPYPSITSRWSSKCLR